jgi:hypothetical protein
MAHSTDGCADATHPRIGGTASVNPGAGGDGFGARNVASFIRLNGLVRGAIRCGRTAP